MRKLRLKDAKSQTQAPLSQSFRVKTQTQVFPTVRLVLFPSFNFSESQLPHLLNGRVKTSLKHWTKSKKLWWGHNTWYHWAQIITWEEGDTMPCYKWRNGSLEKQNDLPKVTEQICTIRIRTIRICTIRIQFWLQRLKTGNEMTIFLVIHLNIPHKN